MKFFYFCINSLSERDLKNLCILRCYSFLTQETVERILDKFPNFFNGLNLYIVSKEQEESWIKLRMADNINYYKSLITKSKDTGVNKSKFSMPTKSLLCP